MSESKVIEVTKTDIEPLRKKIITWIQGIVTRTANYSWAGLYLTGRFFWYSTTIFILVAAPIAVTGDAEIQIMRQELLKQQQKAAQAESSESTTT